MQRESQAEFLIEKMQPAFLLNKSQQAMFGMSVGVSVGLIAGLSVGLLLEFSEPFLRWLYGLGVLLGVGVTVGLDKTIQTVETLSWSWKEVWRNVLVAPFLGLSAGLVAGRDIETKTIPISYLYYNNNNVYKVMLLRY